MSDIPLPRSHVPRKILVICVVYSAMSSSGIRFDPPDLLVLRAVCRVESRELMPPANVIDGPLTTLLASLAITKGDYVSEAGNALTGPGRDFEASDSGLAGGWLRTRVAIAPKRGLTRRISSPTGELITKIFFLAKKIHHIGTRSLRQKKSLPENLVRYRASFTLRAARRAVLHNLRSGPCSRSPRGGRKAHFVRNRASWPGGELAGRVMILWGRNVLF
jgi:hypothetical protein